jgi:aminoglycoside 3-N-acetyltransferase
MMLSRADLVSGLGQTGIKQGDTVVVHASYKSLGGVEGGAETVIDSLLDLVGPEGTLLFATFNFHSWTETHYFDIRETPSDMGMISEIARLRQDASRTPHPIYSFAVLGKRLEEFCLCDDKEAFGDRSVFGLLHRGNDTILSIGLDFNNTFSFHHYVERKTGCDYRRVKAFSGIYVGWDGVPHVKTYSMFVRKSMRIQTYIVPGMNELLEKGVIKEVQVGRAKVHYASAVEFFDNMSEIVRTHPEKLHRVVAPNY